MVLSITVPIIILSSPLVKKSVCYLLSIPFLWLEVHGRYQEKSSKKKAHGILGLTEQTREISLHINLLPFYFKHSFHDFIQCKLIFCYKATSSVSPDQANETEKLMARFSTQVNSPKINCFQFTFLRKILSIDTSRSHNTTVG